MPTVLGAGHVYILYDYVYLYMHYLEQSGEYSFI